MSDSRIERFGVIKEDEQRRITMHDFHAHLGAEFNFPYGKEIGMLKLIIERLQSELNTLIIHSTRDSFINEQQQPIPETEGTNIVLFNKRKDDDG